LPALAECSEEITEIDETTDSESDCCSAMAEAGVNSSKGNECPAKNGSSMCSTRHSKREITKKNKEISRPHSRHHRLILFVMFIVLVSIFMPVPIVMLVLIVMFVTLCIASLCAFSLRFVSRRSSSHQFASELFAPLPVFAALIAWPSTM
jgi:hypothetical protein